MTTTDPAALWQAALALLAGQMTAGTYDAWLRPSRGVSLYSGALTVEVPTTAAQEWLAARWQQRADEAAATAAGANMIVEFVVAAPTTNGATPPLSPSPAPQLESVSIELVEFDPARRGWLQLPHYATIYWQAYLGEPFRLWLTLKSFANARITPSVARLAAVCTNGNRQTLIGRKQHGAWRAGWLEVLERERILWYKKRGNDYTFRVLETLPVLTPAQVGTLPEPLPELHAEWLRQADLDYQEWQQLTLPSLAKGVVNY